MMRLQSARMDKTGTTTQARDVGMTDTQVLLGKIAALRQRLEQAQGLARDADSAAAALIDETRDDTGRVWRLERQVASGGVNGALLDGSLRQLSDSAALPETAGRMPRQLTARARRVLEQAQQLLGKLREQSDQLESVASGQARSNDPLTVLHQETCAMTETVVRFVQAFPDTASAQLRLCEGVEAILTLVGQRLAVVALAVGRRRHETEQMDTLSDLLSRSAGGRKVAVQDFISLAETILAEADQAPLRFPETMPQVPASFVASHSWVVACVIARIVRHDPDLRPRPVEPVLAALVHDVGMLQVPAEVWLHAGPLDDSQRRAMERHTQIGADLAAQLLPSGAWLAEATRGHHERLDGTGYPGGLRDTHIAPLTRLLSACDVYAALCSPRPYRPAGGTRTALADTLLMADQGALDPRVAERLLSLTFYPVGATVELADGAVGVVVATHAAPRDLNTPARPVVAVLLDGRGQPLPTPDYLDLAGSECQSIVRTLSAAERREALGKRYPGLV
jgi:HD-GYP domain-containing protein (c-di-GMP phosphodiesterase class II)